jgi:hypothetical protein
MDPVDAELRSTLMKFRPLFLCLSIAAISGCSSIIEGTSQEIAVSTTPAGAACTLTRNGETIGTVDPTPQTIVVKKRKYDITITCKKPGFQVATAVNESGSAAWTVGNILFLPTGAFIGWGIDSATGADNKYDSAVNLKLVPETEPTDASATK